MDCKSVRQLLALEPKGIRVPHSAAARAHIGHCASCRAFWLTLIEIDEALEARPLAMPEADIVRTALAQIHRYPRIEVAPPFSRAFWVFSAACTLLALVSGAVLLHASTSAPASDVGLAVLWIRPAWSRNANAWLTVECERLAQFVLPVVAGIVITLAGAVVGYGASERSTRVAPPSGKRSHPQQ